jgi:hypothetical protein
MSLQQQWKWLLIEKHRSAAVRLQQKPSLRSNSVTAGRRRAVIQNDRKLL